MKHFSPTPVVLALLMMLTACSGSSSGSQGPSSSIIPSASTRLHPADTLGGVGNLLSILLCDAPPTIGNLTPTAINLGVDSVGVESNGVVTTIASYPTPYVVNVLAEQTSTASIPIGNYFTGAYQQVVFTFDVASSNVVANGTTYPISFLATATQSSANAGTTTVTTQNAASAASSSSVTVTVSGNFLVNGDPAAAVQADFNALESLAMNAQGTIIARPTLFAVPNALAGKVSGTVEDASGNPVSGATIVVVDANGNVANTGSTGPEGNFNIHTIAAGSYQLEIFNSYTTASGQVLTATGNTSTGASIEGPSVTITAGATTKTGTIQD